MSAAAVAVRIKGSVLRTRLALIDDLRPGDGRERVLSRLREDERQELAAPLASGWYPFELGRRLDEAIVAELGGGRRGLPLPSELGLSQRTSTSSGPPSSRPSTSRRLRRAARQRARAQSAWKDARSGSARTASA